MRWTRRQLIANFQSDIGTNGVITSQTTAATLASAAKALNASAVAANLTAYYATPGITFTAASITNWISQAGDGVIGQFAFQVPDATPSTVFTFPSSVVGQFAGIAVTVSAGQLSVNGTAATGSVTFKATDTVTLVPNIGDFRNGVLTVYLQAASKNLSKVSFVAGLASIAIAPSSPSVPLGLTQQFTATGTFTDTSTANLTNSVGWTSATPGTASINASSGLANALAVGSTVITATSGSVSGSVTLNVTPAILESISITPNPATIGIGIGRQLIATGTYSDGTSQNVTTVANWISGNTSIATIGPTTGIATGVSLGPTTVTATIGSTTASLPLTVTTNTWTPTGSLATARVDHTATLLPNGQVLVAGGYGQNAVPLSSAELYSPATGTWTATGSLQTARTEHTATLLQTGQVLVVGGLGASGTVASAELYEPASGTWSTTGSPSMARVDHTATLLPNGNVLLAGGISPNMPSLAIAELYNPNSGTWSLTGSLETGRDAPLATLLANGNVLVAGGDNPTAVVCGPGGCPYLVSAEVYDPTAGTWTYTGNLLSAQFLGSATLLSNGMVLIAGGLLGLEDMPNPEANAELYDPVAGTFSATGSLATARSGHSATLLPNGQVLVEGGNQISAELYDPSSGTWSSAGNLPTTISGNSATLLSNGVVLAAGGLSEAAGLLAAAELYW